MRDIMLKKPRRLKKSRSLVDLANVVVAHRRIPMNDKLLATVLAGIAGAVNAGGLFVVGQYTSHMTGYVSQIADNLVTGHLSIVATSIAAIFTFIIGAAISAMLVNWARINRYHQQYALPIAVQGSILLLVSIVDQLANHMLRLPLLLVLCLLMGMQNATITKLSKARVRTTHVTGMITDIGIEFGKAMFGTMTKHSTVRADTQKLAILSRLVLSYLLGGIVGAIGFASAGFLFALPLSIVLLLLSLPTLWQRKKRLSLT